MIQFIFEDDLPWLNKLDKDTLDSIQGQIFPAKTIVVRESGILVECSLFKVWLFSGSRQEELIFGWTEKVLTNANCPTPSIQVKKNLKNGFAIGLDEESTSKVKVNNGVFTLTPTPQSKGEVKRK